MLKLKLAAITIGFLMLSASTFAQTMNQTTNPPSSQSTASGSGNSASLGTESNTDHPNLASSHQPSPASRQAKRHTRHAARSDANTSPGTIDNGNNSSATSGHTKFPGSDP